MDIIIRSDVSTPIYQQVYEQIRNNIVNKKLKPHEQLPSIRLLAKNLKVSVITSKRAYEELERDGYIYSVAGKGSYVADTDDKILVESYLAEIKQHMDAIIKLASVASISDKKLKELYIKIKECVDEGDDL